jgi:Flp pilus assembly CpaF family ATPase
MAFHLRIFDTEKQNVRVQEIATGSVKIGRSATCDVVLDSPYVSREHAVLRHDQGRFVLESVGLNETSVRGAVVPASAAVEVQPDDEIQIAGFSLFIEAEGTKTAAKLDVAGELGEIELDLHARLLERVDLREVKPGTSEGAGNVRMRQALDELVRAKLPSASSGSVPEEVVAFALRESLYGEVTQEVLRRSGGQEQADRAGGFMAKMDRILAGVVDGILKDLGVVGQRGAVREDLRRVDAGFAPRFERFAATASEELRTLFVQRFLTREILNLLCGFGPLQDLLELPNCSEIMVVQKDLIYIERDGKLERLHRTFISDDILLGVIQRIVEPLGRRVDRSTPLVDARLPDGSRVNAIIPPLAVRGPCLTIRRFSKDPLTAQNLISFGSITPAALAFLEGCVRARKNLVVSGGTGSGKTSLLNILSSFIASDERIVTIEDSAELQLRQPHVVTLETRPPNVEGKGAYTIRDLVKNALRMRPDRIVVGECRGGEALDMLQAMNTGHDGSLTTVHANTPEDALLRLETMVLQAVDLPVRAIRDQIEAAIHVIVQTARLPSGKRMVTRIAEVVGVDPVEGIVVTNDIFEERAGTLFFSGYLPSFVDELVTRKSLDPGVLFAPAEEAAR